MIPSEVGVAPHTGAWIETKKIWRNWSRQWSRPIRARGLKLLTPIPYPVLDDVAPHTGAWIETTSLINTHRPPDVAPHTGAWIETPKSHLSSPKNFVAPHTGAWIETFDRRAEREVRVGSRPIRARGLKQGKSQNIKWFQGVAPHTGAWIETGCQSPNRERRSSRAPYGRVPRTCGDEPSSVHFLSDN